MTPWKWVQPFIAYIASVNTILGSIVECYHLPLVLPIQIVGTFCESEISSPPRRTRMGWNCPLEAPCSQMEVLVVCVARVGFITHRKNFDLPGWNIKRSKCFASRYATGNRMLQLFLYLIQAHRLEIQIRTSAKASSSWFSSDLWRFTV